jgi:hypothetical protein
MAVSFGKRPCSQGCSFNKHWQKPVIHACRQLTDK